MTLRHPSDSSFNSLHVVRYGTTEDGNAVHFTNVMYNHVMLTISNSAFKPFSLFLNLTKNVLEAKCNRRSHFIQSVVTPEQLPAGRTED